jgi:hypothetical protein
MVPQWLQHCWLPLALGHRLDVHSRRPQSQHSQSTAFSRCLPIAFYRCLRTASFRCLRTASFRYLQTAFFRCRLTAFFRCCCWSQNLILKVRSTAGWQHQTCCGTLWSEFLHWDSIVQNMQRNKDMQPEMRWAVYISDFSKLKEKYYRL